jgi:5-methylcytosine-specific restriction endonuclease McrA
MAHHPEWNDTYAVRAFRKQILARDHHRCQVGLPGCAISANTVDHIQALSLGGAALDPRNARACCSSCNSSMGQRLAQANINDRKRSAGAASRVWPPRELTGADCVAAGLWSRVW